MAAAPLGLRSAAQHVPPGGGLPALQAADGASRDMASMAGHFLGSEQLQLLDSLSPPTHWPG